MTQNFEQPAKHTSKPLASQPDFLVLTESAASETLKARTQLIFGKAAPGLALVEARIRSVFNSEAEILAEISRYLFELGGKRIRPILAILTEALFKVASPSQTLIDAAAGIELIHMATLLHDDIIDQSAKRRNKESAYLKYGFTSSLLAGDFLWVRAFGLCAHLGEFIVRKTEAACVELTEGEVLEKRLNTSSTDFQIPSRKDYLQVVDKKTASLFALSAAVGAYCASNRKSKLSDVEPEVAAVENFGRSAGLCFQMVDDILDVISTEDLLGKPSGADLKQHTPSLINILWLESADPRAKEFFSKEQHSPEELAETIEYLKKSKVISEARNLAQSEAEKAKEFLNSLPAEIVDEDVRSLLITLVDFTVERAN